ncbi:type IV pilus assembly protein PilB [Alteribacillus iranensis]|uniref:Type IV pilus assembly protein PilB n=1 Tax=Alteribacillus iranensis TaxID=930128 RepID=A0A1I2CQF6_9BACI|nr:type IV pilus assembly protein PilB [Alteribacillus iranensis]
MAEARKRLGDLLVEAGVVTKDQLEEALREKERDQKLGDVLVEKDYITEQQLLEVLEYQLGVPRVSLHNYPVDEKAVELLPKEAAIRYHVMPLRLEDSRLHTAMADPMDYLALDEIRMTTGFQVEPYIASREDIDTAIHRHYYEHESGEEREIVKEEAEDIAVEGEAAPVIRIVNELLAYGLQQRASDIHLDPQETKLLVRYRVDGVLSTERTFSKSMQSSLIARVKIMADLNITETRLPQDGRIKVTVQHRPVDLRISTLPTVFGEKVVIRILDAKSALQDISEIGMNPLNYERFLRLIERPSGMILLTGPTGSGKSSTLYAALGHLNKEDVNIITVEDPVEYQLDGINQVQVNNEVGLTFAKGLRSILRQDPNIIMVGEVRDKETAEIAIRASLTGHLVFSTIHTNSAIATIPRLIDMGIDPYMVVSSISGIAAQRLVRKICPDCRESYEPSDMEIELFEKRGLTPGSLYKGAGCNACNNTGYRGRMAIHELLEMDEDIQNMLMNQASMAAIRKHALKSGMIFLIDDGLLKAKKGLTTIEEVIRVTIDE